MRLCIVQVCATGFNGLIIWLRVDIFGFAGCKTPRQNIPCGGKGDGARFSDHHPVDQADSQGPVCPDPPACGDQVKRRGDPYKARRPLRAARTGQDAKPNLGKAELHTVDCHPPMSGNRHLQPAAKRCAMQHRDYRLGLVFQRCANLRQPRFLRGFAEFADIGPGDETAPFAVKRDDLHGVIALQHRHGLYQSGAQGVTRRIHRWIVQCDQPVARDLNNFWHRCLPGFHSRASPPQLTSGNAASRNGQATQAALPIRSVPPKGGCDA
jgi:hypothetical protein